jgi:hypothetical protein
MCDFRCAERALQAAALARSAASARCFLTSGTGSPAFKRALISRPKATASVVALANSHISLLHSSHLIYTDDSIVPGSRRSASPGFARSVDACTRAKTARAGWVSLESHLLARVLLNFCRVKESERPAKASILPCTHDCAQNCDNNGSKRILVGHNQYRSENRR